MNNTFKYKVLVNYIIGPILFIVLSCFIYKNLTEKEDIATSWEHLKTVFGQHAWLLTVLVALMLLNWSLEAMKWRYLVQSVEKISLFTGLRAVMSGLSFSLFIPNGLGEYLGRMLYLHDGKRLRSISVSIVGSISQIIVTFTMGLIGTAVMLHLAATDGTLPTTPILKWWMQGLFYFIIASTVLLVLMYFRISWFARWLQKIPVIYRHRIFIVSLESYDTGLLAGVLFFAFLRYLVFLLQYLLVFYMLGVQMSVLGCASATAAMFLIMTVVPTIPVAEVGMRGQISLQLYGLFSSNDLGIVSAAILIWLVNIIIPSILGTLFILGVKIFKNK
ncbi:MAG: lysylphosphatidylglycerol synthase transmembrane domain-containing protein [Chitinophagaceae bacterium]